MNPPLAILPALLARHPHLRRAASASPRSAGVATGNPQLDALLCWHGWPRGALTELLGVPGCGELALLAPTLIRLAHQGGQLFLVDPPHQPHAQGLQQLGIPWDRLLVVRTTRDRDPVWACEQILRSGTCAALLAWEGGGSWRRAQLLRLQSAACAVPGPVFLCRPTRTAQQPSPAVLRLRLAGAATGAQLTLVKQPGPVGQRLALISHPETAVPAMLHPLAPCRRPAPDCPPVAQRRPVPIHATAPASIAAYGPEDATNDPMLSASSPVEGQVQGIPGPLSAARRAH